jgi:hypothetical protein
MASDTGSTLRGDSGIVLKYTFNVAILLDMDDPTQVERASELTPGNIRDVLEAHGFAFAGVVVAKARKTRPARASNGKP